MIRAASSAIVCSLLCSGAAHGRQTLHTRLCLVLPPGVRLGLRQEEALRRDCEQVSNGSFIWEPHATVGYDIATKVFHAIADENRSSSTMTMWFPSVKDESVIESLAGVVQQNGERLGISTTKASSWPEVPATMIELSWSSNCAEAVSMDSLLDSKLAKAVTDTEEWVDDTLCRLSLCPYTASLKRAAIGLESAGVAQGPVVVRHVQHTRFSTCRAAALAASFWEGVAQLATEPETDVATLLLVAPQSYDSDFAAFAAVCDDLIEPSVQAVKADQIVGRAWFHPLYSTESIGHSTVLPGHALPPSMVENFVNKYVGSTEYPRPDKKAIANANDAVRWTPHATINLLRRSQLTAAKKVEAASANRKPNAVYARNVLRILADGKLLNQ